MDLRPPVHRRSPTIGLVVGLLVTVAAVVADSWYITQQIAGLRGLQRDLADRSRRDSLQLLRIQNNLNLVALAMRDMVDNDSGYPLTAWTAQLDRVRLDLDDALRREEALAIARRSPGQRQFLGDSMTQFWTAIDRMFTMVRDGREEEARAQIRLSLLARQAALSTAVARLLVENNESEEQTAIRVEGIYANVQRQVFLFLAATLVAIILTSASVIRANRRLFAELREQSERRHELAKQLITTRESTLREIARELHDEFGQILTAMGSMLRRAGNHAPEGSPLRDELREVRQIAQTTLDNVRGLSQTLHPSILDDAGLDEALEWYVANAERQLGLAATFERIGKPAALDREVAIHVYRIVQEALTNASKHSGATAATVCLRTDGGLEVVVEDHGSGFDPTRERRGLGIVTMRERAELVGGTIEFGTPPGGGTIVRLRIPMRG